MIAYDPSRDHAIMQALQPPLKTPLKTCRSCPHRPGAGTKWPIAAPACYYGLAGDIVQAIAPHSEADPIGI